MEPTHFNVSDIIANWLEPLDRKLRITFENLFAATVESTLNFLTEIRVANYKSTRTIVCDSGKYLVASLLKTTDALLSAERTRKADQSESSNQSTSLSTTLSK